MNQSNPEQQVYPESFKSLYSTYDQQLEQYIANSNSSIYNANVKNEVPLDRQISQSNVRPNLSNENRKTWKPIWKLKLKNYKLC